MALDSAQNTTAGCQVLRLCSECRRLCMFWPAANTMTLFWQQYETISYVAMFRSHPLAGLQQSSQHWVSHGGADCNLYANQRDLQLLPANHLTTQHKHGNGRCQQASSAGMCTPAQAGARYPCSRG